MRRGILIAAEGFLLGAALGYVLIKRGSAESRKTKAATELWDSCYTLDFERLTARDG
jgi:hypothetical protein